MGINGGFYKVLLLLHVLTSIVGFGAVLLNGLYAAQARARKGPAGLAIAEANFAASKVAQYFIYAVFVLGFALVGASDGVYKFSQTWVWLSAVVYVASMGVSHGVLTPTVARINALSAEMVAGGPPPGGPPGPPPQVAQIEELARKIPPAVAYLDVSLVAILALMIWKPGL
ncbi:MAG: hypothetical protein U0V73_12105 [Acidimicrobiia bacterium]